MGYQKKRYKLTWVEGHDLHGLEVSVGGLSIGDLEIMAALKDEAANAKTFDRIMPMLEVFAKALVSWNYEDEEGAPIGTSLAEIKEKGDAKDIIPVILSWVSEVGDISVPLPESSNSGKSFPVELPPMDVPSLNLANFSTPN